MEVNKAIELLKEKTFLARDILNMSVYFTSNEETDLEERKGELLELLEIDDEHLERCEHYLELAMIERQLHKRQTAKTMKRLEQEDEEQRRKYNLPTDYLDRD